VNPLVITRGILGAAELLAPGLLLRVVAGHDTDVRARQVVRVLGAREAVQATVTAVRPSRTILVGGATVDALHALSMVALGVLNRQRRREGLTSAAVAGLFATAEVLAAAD
jgi:hypothetical protein